MNLHQRELELRASTYRWLRAKYEAEGDAKANYESQLARRQTQGVDALALLEQLKSTRDVAAFRASLNALTAPKDSALSLSGPNGQMFLNQIVSNSSDALRAAEILSASLAPPTNDVEASERISDLVDYCVEIRTGTGPQSGRVAPFVSLFWTLAEPAVWPAKWTTAMTAFERLGWTLPSGFGAGYVEFAEIVRSFGDPEDVLGALAWFSATAWLGPDPTLQDRILWAQDLKDQGLDGAPYAVTNIEAVLGPLRQAGDDLNEPMALALGYQVSKRIPPKHRTDGDPAPARYDGYVTWVPKAVDAGWNTPPGFRLWFGYGGIVIGLHPGYRGRGWSKIAQEHLVAPEGLKVLPYTALNPESAQADNPTDVLVGKLIPYDEVDWDAIPDLLVAVASSTETTLQKVLIDGPAWGRGPTARPPGSNEVDAELYAQFREFVQTTGYPTTADEAEGAERIRMAQLISEDSIGSIGIPDFRWLMSTNRWGSPGNHAVLNVTIADPDEDAVQQRIADVVGELLYGSGTDAERLDRCPPKLKGLGQAGAWKLLSVVFPEKYLPIHPLTGAKGKLALLPGVGIDSKPTGTLGERSVEANELLLNRLSAIPELSDDSWGQRAFAYWLVERDVASPVDSIEERLAAATERCTLPPESPFLAELHDLLKDKGQIVLYGPPGTGKTYLALELAAALAPDEGCRSLVQFHPSVAYEDFMEGFRPVLRDGQLTYELQEGPLVELAARAAEDPRPHVLIIDEMNRANLPKVFGELLFLLEYRDRPVQLAYRSGGDTFALPPNLWIIGTMNLADRSVGHIDAALRRRFAFVPFTPSDEQNGGLLRRWLTKRNEPTWPADLVDAVNVELESDLGHTDLLIGPSYFMKDAVDSDRMAVIWRYAIEPLTSDLFHGDDKVVKKYQWESVIQRHPNLLSSGAAGDAPD